MTREENLVRSIMGRGKGGKRDLRIFIYAIEIAGRMIFDEQIPMEEIQVTKSVYPEAGKKCGKTAQTATRQVERLGMLCFLEMDIDQREVYLGKGSWSLSPSEMVFRLAYYCRYERSYEEIIWEEMKRAQL